MFTLNLKQGWVTVRPHAVLTLISRFEMMKKVGLDWSNLRSYCRKPGRRHAIDIYSYK